MTDYRIGLESRYTTEPHDYKIVTKLNIDSTLNDIKSTLLTSISMGPNNVAAAEKSSNAVYDAITIHDGLKSNYPVEYARIEPRIKDIKHTYTTYNLWINATRVVNPHVKHITNETIDALNASVASGKRKRKTKHKKRKKRKTQHKF